MKRLLHIFLTLTLFNPIVMSFAQEVVKFDGKEWSRQQNRKEYERIFSGKVDTAITNMNNYLRQNGADAEIYFGLCVAWYVKNNPEKGFDSFQKAISSELPIERFMAGPRNIFEPLYENEMFKEETRGKELIHGPLLGSVNDRSAKIWIRTFHETPFTVEIAKDSLMTEGIDIFKGTTSSANDYTGIALISGLNPHKEYFYRIKINGVIVSGISNFTTFFNKDEEGIIRIAFGGGASYNPHFERIWSTIYKRRPDAFLAMGDNVYIDQPTSSEVQRFRYYQRQSSPAFREMTSSIPVFSIWDDHDFGVNDSYGGPDKFIPQWKNNVLKIFKENYANPGYAHDKLPGIWYDFSIGNVDFFMLDTRYYRTPSNIDKSKNEFSPNMLGKEQMHWLKERLKQSDALFKVIVSSVPWSDGAKDAMEGRFDTWRGYPEERKEIFDFLTENGINGVTLLSADRHRHDAWKHRRPEDYALYEFTSSRLTNIHYHGLRTGSLFGYNEKNGFGIIEFHIKEKQPYIVYKIINIDNEMIDQVRVYNHQMRKKK